MNAVWIIASPGGGASTRQGVVRRWATSIYVPVTGL